MKAEGGRVKAIVGIDLGTTNSALAWSEAPGSGRAGAPRLFDIPQVVAPGEVRGQATLPSFLYFPTAAERERGMLGLPWNPAPESIAGIFARDHGALVPARQVASAKSWLSNAFVDRTAPLLPWEGDAETRLSPMGASARLLAHLRDGWNAAHGEDPAWRLEAQSVVLAVPASFDEEARELTVQAAREAGLAGLTLLEEPLAALYAWMSTHRRELAAAFEEGSLILVCDVGGGTTDFSLVRASLETGEIVFERTTIGEHLLLGGDNVDLALAVLLEQEIVADGGARLGLSQRQALRRQCSAAKERLLAGAEGSIRITVLGSGRGVVGGARTVELTREAVESTLAEFLPLAGRDEAPARDRRRGLRELGLPFETEPGITRHLAGFLARAGGGDLARPDAVLFNGGFFTPALARERVLQTLERWFGARPRVLHNERPEAAVAIGAAVYGRLRADPAAARRLIIRAGAARTYYIGVDASGTDRTAVCVMPRGTQEGTSFALNREFAVTTNRPAAFTLYSSPLRTSVPGEIVVFAADEDVHTHAPLVTVLRFGKRSRRAPIAVRLSATYTEVGTLELWCEAPETGHRWRLQFSLRASEDPDAELEADGGDDAAQVIIPDRAVETAETMLRAVFGPDEGTGPTPEALVGEIENVLGHGKQAWPLAVLRRLADALLELAPGRRRGSRFEARWLNLVGFCARPGFGTSTDQWRVGELRKVYAAGLAFPKDVQCQVEWLVLWQRVSAGFSAGQQRELAQRVAGQIGIGDRRGRVNPQIEREGWRLLANLERLDAGYRTKLGDELLDRLKKEPRNSAFLWAIGRLGARTPFHGPLNTVVPPAVAERWLHRLLTLKGAGPDLAAAIAQIAARTDDPARDLADEIREQAIAHLAELGAPGDDLQAVRVAAPGRRVDAVRVFGEDLPEGLRLVSG